MLLLLLACDLPTEPGARPIAPRPLPAVYALTGRAVPDGLDVPGLPEARALVADDCRALAELLGPTSGSGCFVERWAADGHLVFLHQAGDRLAFSAQLLTPGPARSARWPSLGAVLSACIGDPLALPPAADPSGTRRLTPSALILHLSGDNLCHLQGEIQLFRDADRADAALLVDGMPWKDGGREQAQILLRADLRRIVTSEWGQLSPEAQALALEVLADDPQAQQLLPLLHKPPATPAPSSPSSPARP